MGQDRKDKLIHFVEVFKVLNVTMEDIEFLEGYLVREELAFIRDYIDEKRKIEK